MLGFVDCGSGFMGNGCRFVGSSFTFVSSISTFMGSALKTSLSFDYSLEHSFSK